ncbi:2-amino-4-hydroxy-6-hydroxymethyldihydropteridine diphosphokinase [Croceicoccus bisphenolivorans]|uniref:2-amino-4-hydroxy-6- hydroxymethyldihydropteridine diphosphokinase n=1 Tax=Croceicoccus bisphenolivorans TaxID=1783232 RepID=UPI00082C5B23|nr:2-amino-4-hydroxy-6-hydroxymethyldihydropteridine diphosphokinase [Croceicoccus bisphenolivorans]
MSDRRFRYLIALGGNVPHVRHGNPTSVLRAAIAELSARGQDVIAASRIVRSRPIGPSRRQYANGAVLLASEHEPPEMLELLKGLERDFDRSSRGRRWSARTLDCDIILWSGGAWGAPGLTIPHPEFRTRSFVLEPSAEIARRWRDPLTSLTIGQLLFRHRRQCA